MIKINFSRLSSEGHYEIRTAEVSGKTLGECLENLFQKLPGTRAAVFDKNNRPCENFYIYINGDNLYPVDLSRPVGEGDQLDIGTFFLIDGG